MIEYTIQSTSELDGYYLDRAIWVQELDEETIANGVVCQAFDEDDFEVGVLAIDAKGKILIVEVKPEHRRRDIATKMLDLLLEAGYRVEHDWDNMRDDGGVWARSVSARPVGGASAKAEES